MKVSSHPCSLLVALGLLFVSTSLYAEEKVKNVILMIGDGMGPQQVGLLQTYADLAPNSIYQGKGTAISRMMKHGETGLVLTHPANAIVADSACSATQLATGFESSSEMLGLDEKGRKVRTILQFAKAQGKSVGLISDTRLTHATVAAFVAHQDHRSRENAIAREMITEDVDVLLAGGIRHFLPQSVNKDAELRARYQAVIGQHIKIKSSRKDERDVIAEARELGYTTVFNWHDLEKAQNKVLGLFAYSGMENGIKNSALKKNADRVNPTLAEMTQKAIEILSKNENGFFLMVEGGQIDWAGHNNDTGTMLHEMIKFDDAVSNVIDWAKTREDTVVLMTADHETGGFGFSYSRYKLPEPRELESEAFKDRLFKPNFNFADRSVLDQIYAQKVSFADLLVNYGALEPGKRNAERLAEMIEDATGFTVTKDDAIRILTTEPNSYHVLGHKYLSAETFPKIDDFESFYVYGEEVHRNIIGRVLAKQQNTVWATGTHTATPVTVTAFGPASLTKQVRGIHTQPEIGQMMLEWFGAKPLMLEK